MHKDTSLDSFSTNKDIQYGKNNYNLANRNNIVAHNNKTATEKNKSEDLGKRNFAKFK